MVRLLKQLTCIAAVGAFFVAALPAAAQAPSVQETRAIAEEGYIYGLPIVMNYAVMYDYAVNRQSPDFKAPFNQIKNEPRVFTYKDTAIITPNSDTPYSFAWLDLRAEPVVLSVPAVAKDRYYSVMLVDGNTFNYGYIGSRATGSAAGNYLIVGPKWQGEKPAGINEVFRSTTDFTLAGYRTQLFGPKDMDNVKKVQAGFKVRTLSAFQNKPAPPAAAALDFPKIDKALAQQKFFDYLAFALQFAPPGPEEQAIRARLASIGVEAGKPVDFGKLPPEQRMALVEGVKAGQARVTQYLESAPKVANGWKMTDMFGDRAFFNGDWIKRAAGAQGGIYGNDAIEAAYPLTRTLADGTLLDGSKHDYTITFPAGQLPPVKAFWSLTIYDGKTQLLIKNPINRYLINSPMLKSMKKNADGSMTLYVQHQSPGKDKEANWLPAPDGEIYLAMRLYWPDPQAPSVLPIGEGSWKPPAIQVAR